MAGLLMCPSHHSSSRPHSKPKMKLLILAQVPPPVHGQSVMVRTAVDGLPQHGIEVTHINLRLSRTSVDIGGWQLGKVLAILDACFHAIVARLTDGCDTLYYVPTPAKRGALYRDWLVMALCRPFFRRLVLHFHNGGLGDWIRTGLTAPERAITHALLGRADLAIVLANSLRDDAEALTPTRVAVVPNGINPPPPLPRTPAGLTEILFLGQVCADKGALVLLAAVRLLRQRGHPASVVFAGPVMPDAQSAIEAALRADPGCCRLAGFVGAEAKAVLFARSTMLVLPTHYDHEAQPLVLLESLAADLPIVATLWRGIPESMPATVPLVAPGEIEELAAAIAQISRQPPSVGAHRRWFEQHFTVEQHLAALARELLH